MNTDTNINANNSDLLVGALKTLINQQDLDTDTTAAVISEIMHGHCPDAMMAAILTALCIKGESTDEIVAAARVMLSLANMVDVDVDAVDIVGTGGDGANLFNISTAAAFVVAATGQAVIKHGSTGVSTTTGASDLLTQAGIQLVKSATDIKKIIEDCNMAFLFAPFHHPAMRHAKNVRGILKIRTIFNILGPLLNPARVQKSLVGAYNKTVCLQMAKAASVLGIKHALFVHSLDGLDEISLSAPTFIAEVKDGQMREYLISPEDFGIKKQSLNGLHVKNAAESLHIIKQALNTGESSPAKDIIALNAGAALYVAGKTDDISSGVLLAQQILSTDKAYQKMRQFAKATQQFKI